MDYLFVVYKLAATTLVALTYLLVIESSKCLPSLLDATNWIACKRLIALEEINKSFSLS